MCQLNQIKSEIKMKAKEVAELLIGSQIWIRSDQRDQRVTKGPA